MYQLPRVLFSCPHSNFSITHSHYCSSLSTTAEFYFCWAYFFIAINLIQRNGWKQEWTHLIAASILHHTCISWMGGTGLVLHASENMQAIRMHIYHSAIVSQ